MHLAQNLPTNCIDDSLKSYKIIVLYSSTHTFSPGEEKVIGLNLNRQLDHLCLLIPHSAVQNWDVAEGLIDNTESALSL